MHVILTLLRKDFANLRRNRAALVLSFAVPMIIIYVVGLVFGLGRSNSGPTGIPFAVVNESDNPAAQKLVAALQAEKSFRVITGFANADKTTRALKESDLRPMIRDRQFSYALVIPSDVISEERFGIRLKVLSDPRNDIENQIVNGILQKTIFSSVPQLLGQALQARARNFVGAPKMTQFNHSVAASVAQAFGGDAAAIEQKMEEGDFGFDQMKSAHADNPGESSAGSGDMLSRIAKIETEQVVGREVKAPEATRIVGGYAVMFLLFALSNSTAAFFDEKNTGIFQRLLSSPVTRGQLLWSRFLYGVLFGLAQLMALFFAGHLLYGVDVFGHLGNLVVICVSVAAACTGFGMFLAAVCGSAEAARSMSTLLVITMSACGGAWFPVSLMPEFMQHIARFTLVYWAIEGFNAVLWAGETLVQLTPILGLLLGMTAVIMTIAVWRFNRGKIFD
ncbi:MAG TPA: ABC transporter permease [Lacunisphaera sp.]|jgi:ABC-2 type transport system permease protein